LPTKYYVVNEFKVSKFLKFNKAVLHLKTVDSIHSNHLQDSPGISRNLQKPKQPPSPKKTTLKAVLVHNFNLKEKATYTVEATTNFLKKFKVHFEKRLLYYMNYFFCKNGKSNDLCM
jgi:hypothetical protein